MSTKILALTDALGNLVRFALLPGHCHDGIGVAPLIEDVTLEGLIADKAFDSNALVAELNERGAKVVISQHPARSQPLRIDLELYKDLETLNTQDGVDLPDDILSLADVTPASLTPAIRPALRHAYRR